MGSVQHVILTRFNLPSAGNESYVREREGWLKGRVALFERYCLPSVAAQTSRAFDWIIYFDPASPPWLLAWIAEHAAAGEFRPIFRAQVSLANRLEDIAARPGFETPAFLITTNLDNDDGLAADYVERLQAVEPSDQPMAIYFANGIIRTHQAAYFRVDRRNAFCNVIEPWEGALTCWAAHHDKLNQVMDERRIDGPPAWLQVVHDTNVSNRARGRLISPRRHAERFGRLLDDLAEPSSTDYMGEYLLHAPQRAIREAARAGTKRLVYAVGGADGADRVKAAWTRLRHGHHTRH